MLLIVACANGLRTKEAKSAPRGRMLSTYVPRPRTRSGSSTRRTAFPRIDPTMPWSLFLGGHRLEVTRCGASRRPAAYGEDRQVVVASAVAHLVHEPQHRRVQRAVLWPGERVDQTALAHVDVLVASLDQPVGEQQQRLAGEERHDDAHAAEVAGAEQQLLGRR